MNNIELYPFQKDAVSKAEEEFSNGNKHVLLVMPTGCGKTITFSEFIRRWMAKSESEKVLILAHRNELLNQAQDKLYSRFGIESVIERGRKSTILGSDCRVCISSVQGMQKRLARFPENYFGLVVVDEAHHITSNVYQDVLDHFSDAYVLGVTATPGRNDDRPLSSFFQMGSAMSTL